MSAPKKEPLKSTMTTNKRPEDFMKDEIPLFLSEKIKFTMSNRKWNCEITQENRTKKK